MADNKLDDWEDVELTSEVDDWEEVSLEPETEEPKSDIADLSLPGYSTLKAGENLIEDIAPEVTKGAKGLAKETITKLPFGKLDSEDIDLLVRKGKEYKELKKAPGKLGDKFAEFAKQLEQTGYTATKNVGDVLEAQGKSMKTEDLISELETRASDITYQPDEVRLKEAEKASQDLVKAEQDLQKATETFDTKESDIKSQVDEIDDTIAERKSRSFKRQELSRMRDVEKQSLDETIDSLKDEKARLSVEDKSGKKQIDNEIEQLQRQKRKLGENLKEQVYLDKKEVEKELKEIDKLQEKKKALKKELAKDVLPNKKKELARLEELKKIASKTAEEKAIQRKALTEEAEKYLGRLKKQLSNKKTLTGQDLANEMKRLNKQFGKPGADEIRKAFRGMLGDMSEYVGESGKRATEAITDYENVLKDLPLEQTTKVSDLGKGSAVRQQDDFARKLAGMMVTEEGAELTRKADVIEMLKRVGREDLIDEAELNKILNLTKESQASLLDVGAAVKTKGTAVAPAKRTLETFGTKAQELAATGLGTLGEFADSPAGKVAKGVGKGALRTLPIIGAGLDYAEAGELGLESPLAKGLYTGVEALNPLPVSTGQMYEMLRDAEPETKEKVSEAVMPGISEMFKSVEEVGATPEGEKIAAKLREEYPSIVKGYETFRDFIKGDSVKAPERVSNFIKDKNNSDQLVGQLREANSAYADRVEEIAKTTDNNEDYERKMGMLQTEPAFRELVRRRMRRMSNESKDRKQD